MTQAFNLALLANNVNSSGQLNADTGIYNTVNVANGGTNLSSTPTNGQLLIGNGSGYTLSTLTASTGISITNASGSITITNTQPNATVDVQTFNATGPWTKPTTGQTMARIQVWGGGGGGSRTNVAGASSGGGGGGYSEVTVPLSYINSQTVTVGAAGVGRTASTGNGTAGGTSSVVLATAWDGRTTIAAYGGGGGGNSGGGGGSGGGPLSAGVTLSGNSALGGQPYIATYAYDPCNGSYVTSGGIKSSTGFGGFWHGGGGSVNTYPAGSSIYGGGGGSQSSGTNGAGLSVYGGNGGANAAGATPAGGGGCGGSNVNGSNGGGGRVVITCW